MTLGELIDAIRRVEGAELDLNNAKQSVLHGGNEITMKAKHDAVKDAEWWLNHVRDEDL